MFVPLRRPTPGSSDPQPTIAQYQDRGHSQTFRIESKVGSNFPDPVAHCVLPTLGHQRKQWNFLPPIYDQSPLMAAGLMSPGYPPLIAHKAELCTPLLSVRLSHPPPSRNSLELTCVPEKCDILPSSTPIPCIIYFALEISVASCS